MEGNQPLKYDAFISYRHVEPDMTVAARLHAMLETFKLPKGVDAAGHNRPFRVFRDREELSTADLSDSIVQALSQSRHLIVICSKQTPLSPWCAREIETFRAMHGDEGIIAVLMEGEPHESFPKPLQSLTVRERKEDGTEEIRERELLAAELRPPQVQDTGFAGYAQLAAENSPKVAEYAHASVALLKTEIVRIVAGMLGVSYGDLKQRARERRLRLILKLVSAGLAIVLAFGIVMLNLYFRATEAELQSTQQSSLMTMSRAQEAAEGGDRMKAVLIGGLAMGDAREEMPAYERLHAQYIGVLNEALLTPPFSTTQVLNTGQTSPLFSAGEKGHILTSGADNLALLWDGSTGARLHEWEHPLPVRAVALSRDETRGYTVARDGILREWDATDGTLLREVVALPDAASDILPTQDGNIMVVANLLSGVDLVDLKKGEMIARLNLAGARLRNALVQPHGESLVTILNNGAVHEWNVVDGTLKETLRKPDLDEAALTPVGKFTKDGSVLVLMTEEGLRIRDMNTRAEKIVAADKWPPMHQFEISDDGNTLYTPVLLGDRGSVEKRNLETGEIVDTFSGKNGSIRRIALSPDGQKLVAIWDDNTLTMWDVSDPVEREIRHETGGHTDTVTVLQFTPDGSAVLTGSMDGTVRVTEMETTVSPETVPGEIRAVSPNGQTVLLERDFAYFLCRWEGEPVPIQGAEEADMLSIFVITDDGKTAAYTRSGPGDAVVFDTETGERRFTASGHSALGLVEGIALSNDETLLATMNADGETVVHSLEDGKQISKIQGPTNAAEVSFSEDGALLAITSYSDTVTVLRRDNGEELERMAGQLMRIEKKESGYVGIGLHGDTLFQWEESGGVRSVGALRERRGITSADALAVLSPDGTMLMTEGKDSIVLSDVKTGEKLRSFVKRGKVQPRGVFHPDGEKVLYSAEMGTAQLDDLVDYETLLKLSQERLRGRVLTKSELLELGR